MDNALKGERDELARLKSERESAERALNDTLSEIKMREAEARKGSRQVEEQIQVAITNAVNSAPALLSSVAVLKPFLVGTDRGDYQPQQKERPIYLYPRWKLGPNPLSALKDLRPKM